MVDLHDEFRDTLLFNRARIDRRAADALTGLAAGLIADGVVSQQEAEFLESWIAQNMAHIDDPVINILYGRLQAMLKDGVLDQEEAAELLKMLQSFAGVRHSPAVQRSLPSSFSCDLPLNQPPPLITVENQMFLFTGVMAFGPRRECEAQITARGGVIAASVSKKVDYLVVGSIGNEQWRHSTYGAKIIKAVELREKGARIAILGEDHWQRSLFG